jgi:hypothetical protein
MEHHCAAWSTLAPMASLVSPCKLIPPALRVHVMPTENHCTVQHGGPSGQELAMPSFAMSIVNSVLISVSHTATVLLDAVDVHRCSKGFAVRDEEVPDFLAFLMVPFGRRPDCKVCRAQLFFLASHGRVQPANGVPCHACQPSPRGIRNNMWHPTYKPQAVWFFGVMLYCVLCETLKQVGELERPQISCWSL